MYDISSLSSLVRGEGLALLYGIVSPKHLGEGKGVPDEDADELVPAVHASALVQAPLAGTQDSPVDSEHHPPDFDRSI